MASALAVWSCAKQDKAAGPPPAKVENPVAEASLTTVTLTEQASNRLGILTEPVRASVVAAVRTVGGEVVVPPGHSLLISAPVAGTVLAPPSGVIPAAGARVSARQMVMRLVALPADRDLLRTEQEVTASAARLRQAEAQAQRVANLYKQQLVSAEESDRAAADLTAARASWEGAAAQRGLIRNGAARDAGELTPLAITAPEGGVIRTLAVAPGQAVAAGAPLAEVVRLDRLWIRVPVYAGVASSIDRTQPATVHALSGAAEASSLRAQPVAAPPAADPTSSSVYLFYEVRAGSSALRPGERVGVTLPLVAAARSALSVPLSAVVRDMHGGTWVYQRTAPYSFTRRRIEVARAEAGRVFLAAGLEEGSEVVTAGAAELFGTEFGAGK